MSKFKILSSLAPKSHLNQIVRRSFLGLLGFLVILILFIVVSIWFDSIFGRSATDFANISYASEDGTKVYAYLAQPESYSEKLPAIMMFHEWWGLNADIVKLADALAQEGYIVLAPDLYRGKTTLWIPRAIWLVSHTDQDQINTDMNAGFNYLININNVDAEHIGSTGFCFGGRQSIELAQSQQENLAAMVSLYGKAYTDISELNTLPANIPLLGIFGEEDQSIKADDVRVMDKLMDEVGLNHEITIYPGVGHAFVTSQNYTDIDAASGQAWNQMVSFLRKHLQNDASGSAIITVPSEK